jgi:hypothetical protein
LVERAFQGLIVAPELSEEHVEEWNAIWGLQNARSSERRSGAD